jgi:AcrR family transcriptional regulator
MAIVSPFRHFHVRLYFDATCAHIDNSEGGFVKLPNFDWSMSDRKQDILNAGLAILREEGLAGLTQPRVAARAGVRQGHMTYYFPTRIDLLTAVARAAIDAQSNAATALLRAISSTKQGVDQIASVVVRHENTRLLAALNQAADQQPAVRELFGELLETFVSEIRALLERLHIEAGAARIDLVHALFVGLSIIDLATGRPNGQDRAKAVLKLAFDMLE